MIDKDSIGLIGPDESEDLHVGGCRQDLWLASYYQLKKHLNVKLNVSNLNPSHHSNTHTHRLRHLSSSIPLPPPPCLTIPNSAPLPPDTQAIYTNTSAHTHITHIAHKCQCSPRNNGLPASSICLHPHTHMHGYTYTPRSWHLVFSPAALSMASHTQNNGSINCARLKLPVIQSINPGFITVIVISRPLAPRIQDAKKQRGRIILIQHSDQIFFKSNLLLHILGQCSSKTEKEGSKVWGAPLTGRRGW